MRLLLDDHLTAKRHRVGDDRDATFGLREFGLLEGVGDTRINLGVFHGRLLHGRFFDRSQGAHRRLDRDRPFELALFVRAQRVTRIERFDVVVDRLLDVGIRQTSHEGCRFRVCRRCRVWRGSRCG